MSAIAPREDPGTLSADPVRVGDPVRSMTWLACANALNYLNAAPRAIIPWHAPGVTLTGADGTQAFSYKVYPSYQATHRLWYVAIVDPAYDTSSVGTVTFTDPSGGSSTLDLDAYSHGLDGGTAVLTHIETVSSRTASESTLAPTLAFGTSETGEIGGLACFELPRRELAQDANDLGLELASFIGGAPIYNGTAGQSLGALPESLAGAVSRNRRALVQWAAPATTALAWSTTSTSYVDFTRATGLEALDRKLYGTGTTATVEARVLAWVSGGTGDVSITLTNGSSVTQSITATTPTWVSPASLAVNVESLSDTKGRQSSTPDILTVQVRKNTSGTIYIAGLGLHGAV